MEGAFTNGKRIGFFAGSHAMDIPGLLVMFFCVRPNIRRHRAEEDYAAEGMCMGMCLGMAFGSLIGEGNGGLGNSLGMLIGLAAGLCLHKKEKRHEK